MNFTNHIEDCTQLFKYSRNICYYHVQTIIFSMGNVTAMPNTKKEVTTYSDAQESNLLGYSISRTISFNRQNRFHYYPDEVIITQPWNPLDFCFAKKVLEPKKYPGPNEIGNAVLLYCHYTIASKQTSFVEQMSIDLLPFMVLGLS
jgi:hypothetical protein